MFAFALTWIAVGIGLISPNAEAASNHAMPLFLLPLLSSAFIPVDSMPGWFQPIAEYQPFTPAIETLRGLLLGSEIGHNGWLAVIWCLGLGVLGYFWSASTFDRDRIDRFDSWRTVARRRHRAVVRHGRRSGVRQPRSDPSGVGDEGDGVVPADQHDQVDELCLLEESDSSAHTSSSTVAISTSPSMSRSTLRSSSFQHSS